MAADPAPLTDNDRYRLSWEAATERFYDAAYTGSRKTQQHFRSKIAIVGVQLRGSLAQNEAGRWNSATNRREVYSCEDDWSW